MQIIKILLADDDADDREFFRQAVANSGVEVEFTAVSDGLQLIELLSSIKNPILPDVIFLDLNMPGLNGKVCLREIRKQDKFSSMPVIILSTSTRPKDIDETYLGGANRYISKIVFYANSVEWVGKLFPHADWQKTLMNPTREGFAIV
jgi:CheY-like chemotaxis protein